MSSVYGKNIKISIFGQSHSEAIGVCIDGLSAGLELDLDALGTFLKRRAPGVNSYSTQRAEPDEPEFLSGLIGGVTTGDPICAIIKNKDARSADYEKLRDIPRPGHADFTAFLKYGGARDIRGGGHFSGRLTAPLCVAGGICLQILRREGIEIAAHLLSVGDVYDTPFDPAGINRAELSVLRGAEFPVLSSERGEKMLKLIEAARNEGDSVGGVIECAAAGVPGGIGGSMFDGMESKLSGILFGIPAVRGVEFGNGFVSTALFGSQNNDEFYIDGKQVRTRTNNHGGILGGITSGMPIVFRAAIKPTPSIAKRQDSVNLKKMKNMKLTVGGRHDPCIAPRAVPCIEAAAAIAIYDAMLDTFS